MREETGLDITGMLVEEDCIERHIKQQRSKLYIITGVCYGPSVSLRSAQELAEVTGEELSSVRRSLVLILTATQVEETTEFEPQVRGEIGAFGWHFVTSLPASEEAAMQYNTAEGARHNFYQVCAALTSCTP